MDRSTGEPWKHMGCNELSLKNDEDASTQALTDLNVAMSEGGKRLAPKRLIGAVYDHEDSGENLFSLYLMEWVGSKKNQPAHGG